MNVPLAISIGQQIKCLHITGDKVMEDKNSKNELSMQKTLRFFVNKKEVINYDFSYLKNGIKEVIDSIGIKMGQLGMSPT